MSTPPKQTPQEAAHTSALSAFNDYVEASLPAEIKSYRTLGDKLRNGLGSAQRGSKPMAEIMQGVLGLKGIEAINLRELAGVEVNHDLSTLTLEQFKKVSEGVDNLFRTKDAEFVTHISTNDPEGKRLHALMQETETAYNKVKNIAGQASKNGGAMHWAKQHFFSTEHQSGGKLAVKWCGVALGVTLTGWVAYKLLHHDKKENSEAVAKSV